MTPRALACASALLVSVGCVENGGDRAWGLDERRSFVAGERAPGTAAEGPDELGVFVPLGLERERVVVAVSGDLTFEKNSKLLFGSRGAVALGRGSVTVASGARSSSLYGGARTRLDDGSLVAGYVKTCGPLELGRAQVADGVLRNAGCALDRYSWPVVFPPTHGGERHSSAEGGPVLLAPGAYGDVTVGSSSSVRLSTGTYYLDSLTVAAQGVLELDNVYGPIYVWVRQALQVDGSLQDFWFLPSILFGYGGLEAARIGSEFRGTLVAPFSSLTLPATARPHSGSFFAKDLTLAAGASLEHRAFVVQPPANARHIQPVSLCEECAAEASRAERDCCRTRSEARREERAAQMSCELACTVGGNLHHECAASCRERALSASRRSSSWATACKQSVSFTHSECQLRSGYRADTCHKLGLGLPPAAACAE